MVSMGAGSISQSPNKRRLTIPGGRIKEETL
jgi:hypothetical protein